MKKLVIILSFCLIATTTFSQQQKYALVIGNGTYTNFGSLRNAINDANDMTEALRSLGFIVESLMDGNLTQMEQAVIRLKERLSNAGNDTYGFFYYAGHGVQVDGMNYLIPANANIPDKDFLRERAISAQTILDMLNRSQNALNIVVLDACRDFPAIWSRGTDRGLAVMHPPTNSIIMYATAAGRTASDGTGRNGLFTGYLLKHLKTPEIEVNEVFRRTMSDVSRASNNQQRPAMYTDFSEIAFLGARPVPPEETPPVPVVVQPNAQPAPAPVVQPTPTPASTPTPVVQTPPTPQQSVPSTQQPAPAPQTAVSTERPAPVNMVRIFGSTFMMGSPLSEAGRDGDETQRRVTVDDFYMGKYPVTQREYQSVMGSNPSYFKGNDLPVESVSWYDAVTYCNKLSEREGLSPAYTINGTNVIWNRNANGYRLPTEAEWEYACRAGTTSPYSTGNTITTSQANFNSSRTTPVGTYTANAWGLYDMHGNVWEWCWDWYGTYPSSSETNPVGPTSGASRVLRGGCWDNSAADVRSANRNNRTPTNRYIYIGFRLVRS